ncbi:hypothetical protein Anas_00324 [Armadillidium nasatum]|uniref:Uncharacterized protein n=1 Tax=Armadillidium nasatum TaxID=96803 RepID=A0A5N5TJY0_9CRUS|nr:hypothetical protein Anas_00324 [Armadillidium nasatum]
MVGYGIICFRYMCIGIGHFMDLTIEMYGSEKVMAYYCKDKVVNLRSILVCKCFICIPRCKEKYNHSQMVNMANEMDSSSLLFSQADPHGVQLWYLQTLNLLSFLTGVAALLLVRSLVVDDLQERYNYNILNNTVVKS